MENISYICTKLLPLLGFVVLIFLIILLFKLIKFINSLDILINKTHGSIELLEKSLDKIQVPLDSTVRISKNIDKACDMTSKVINDTREYVSKNWDTVKEKVSDSTNKYEKTEQRERVEEVSRDDILGKGE